MVHGLVDVGEEGVRDQQIVNGQHDLVVRNGQAVDLSTRNMVLGGNLAENRELLPLLSPIAWSVGLYLNPFDSAVKRSRAVFE